MYLACSYMFGLLDGHLEIQERIAMSEIGPYFLFLHGLVCFDIKTMLVMKVIGKTTLF